MKTLADLKRDLTVGKRLTMTFNRLADKNKAIRNRLGIPRKILRKQTKAIYLELEDSCRGSFLELPQASLIEYDGKIIRIYEPGKRKKEKGKLVVEYTIE